MIWFVSFDVIGVVAFFIAVIAFGSVSVAMSAIRIFMVDCCKWIVFHPAVSIIIWIIFALIVALLICLENSDSDLLSVLANFIMLAPFGVFNFLVLIPYVIECQKGNFSLVMTWFLYFTIILIATVVVMVFSNKCFYNKGFLLLLVAIIFITLTVFLINKYNYNGDWSQWITYMNMYGFELGA